jgi:hypothetical protein
VGKPMNERADGHIEVRYTNHMQVAYTEDEFVLEFGQVFQEAGDARIHTRIVTSPAYARVILDTLAQFVGEYERVTGADAERPRAKTEKPGVFLESRLKRSPHS